MFVVADLVSVAIAGGLAFWIRFQSLDLPQFYQVAYQVGLLLCLLFTVPIFSHFGLYRSWRDRSLVDQAAKVTFAWFFVIASLILLAFFLKVSEIFSRQWLAWFAALGWAMLILARSAVIVALRYLHKRGLDHKRLLVLGAGSWSVEVIRRVHAADWLGMDVVALLDHDPARHGADVEGIRVLGDYDRLPDTIERERIDEVWICLPLQPATTETLQQIERIRHILRHHTVTLRLVPDIDAVRLLHQPITDIIGLSVFTLNSSPMRGLNRVIKALEDRLLALSILVLVSPLMLVIAVAIRATSEGPVLFRQQRHGWDGKPFTLYKFRTMHADGGLEGQVTQASRSDARVTSVGRFLRRTSLDELPQFFNVLQGHMSIVGPRPHAVEHNEYYMDQIDFYMQRHKVKPGISGWAQVNGLRGETRTLDEMKKRVEYDLYYIENWSLWLDVKIILLSLLKGFVHEKAY